jgi:inosine-uridine nucleoside N-ribohydrolase
VLFSYVPKDYSYIWCVYLLFPYQSGSVRFQKSCLSFAGNFRYRFRTDYDDVGAITLLHCFADSNYIRILATMASSKHKNAAAAINVFNTYFSRPEIPIGVVRGNAVALGDNQHWTDSVISRYPHQIKSNQDVPDALELYRKILAAQPDHSVTIITVGFLTNWPTCWNHRPMCIQHSMDMRW